MACENNNIEILQIPDNCNGERKSTNCVIYPTAITYLSLPSGATATQVIDNLLLSLVDARNRVQLLETQIDNTTLPYKVYRALLTQNLSDDPTSLVLENTIGESIVWKRSSTGTYTAEVSSGFDITKTFCKTNGFASVNVQLFSFINTVNNKIVLNIRDIVTELPVDRILNNTPIEIIVYN